MLDILLPINAFISGCFLISMMEIEMGVWRDGGKKHENVFLNTNSIKPSLNLIVLLRKWLSPFCLDDFHYYES